MKISIITVCLNASCELEKTLQSIEGQTCKDFELIVFDGNSNDDTPQILEKYKNLISILSVKKDKGIYNAMNNAIQKANGDYIIFLNAGDTFYSNDIIEKTINEIKRLNYPKIVFGYANYIDTTNKVETIHKFENFYNKDFYYDDNICHQAIFYKKDIFKNDKYDESFKLYADWDFNARCAKIKKMHFEKLNFCVCNYYIGGLSTQEKNCKITKKEKRRIKIKYFKKEYFIKNGINRFFEKQFHSIYKMFQKG